MQTPDLSPRARAVLGKFYRGRKDRLTFDRNLTCPSPQAMEVLQELVRNRLIFRDTDCEGSPVYRLTILGSVVDRAPCATPAESRAFIKKHLTFPIYALRSNQGIEGHLREIGNG